MLLKRPSKIFHAVDLNIVFLRKKIKGRCRLVLQYCLVQFFCSLLSVGIIANN